MEPKATLIAHRGAVKVPREALYEIEAPPATETWKPIKHAVLVDAIHEELTRREIGVNFEQYAVQRRNNMLFGVMVLNWLQTDEFAAALAFRHANDMSEAVKMYAGVRVFACDNMALSGDEIILHRRHSKRFDIREALPEAFDKYQHGTLQLQRDIEELKRETISPQRAALFVYDIFRRKIVPIRLFHPVIEDWHMRVPDAGSTGSMWTLHNCFTNHTKHLAPNVAMRAMVKLGKFFGLGKGQV
jgi:hypothetical protein